MVKKAGIVCAAFAVWGVSTFAAGDRPGSTPVVEAFAPIIASAPRPVAPAAEAPRVLDFSQEAPLPQRLQEAPVVTRELAPVPALVTERRGRRSRRNVWVGPIPGPADWA